MKPTQMMLEKMHIRWLGEAMPTTDQKQKFSQEVYPSS